MSLQTAATETLVSEIREHQESVASARDDAKSAAMRCLAIVEELATLATLAPRSLPGHGVSRTWCIQNGIDFEEVARAMKIKPGLFNAENLRLAGIIDRQQKKEFSSRKEAAKPKSFVWLMRELMGAFTRLAEYGLDQAAKNLLMAHWAELTLARDRLLAAAMKPQDTRDEQLLWGEEEE